MYILVICDTPEEMSGGIICILNTTSPPHVRTRHFPISYEQPMSQASLKSVGIFIQINL